MEGGAVGCDTHLGHYVEVCCVAVGWLVSFVFLFVCLDFKLVLSLWKGEEGGKGKGEVEIGEKGRRKGKGEHTKRCTIQSATSCISSHMQHRPSLPARVYTSHKTTVAACPAPSSPSRESSLFPRQL